MKFFGDTANLAGVKSAFHGICAWVNTDQRVGNPGINPKGSRR